MSTLLRQATNATRNISRLRAFGTTTARRADIIQDLYIREIKSYKPAPVAKDAHVGVVKAFSPPSPPSPPALPSDLAAELSAYDAAEVTLAQTSIQASTETTDAGNDAEAYLSFLEQDLPKPDVHHH